MSALRHLSYVMGVGGDESAPDEETPHRHHHHRHLHHHHHEKKDYTVAPTGGNVPVKIPSDEEAQRHRHRHRRRRASTAPEDNVPRPLRVIDPDFEPKKSRPHKRSSVSSNGTTNSDSSAASSGGIEIRGDRRSHGESRECPPACK